MAEGSFYYLLWGWALILASLANYFLIRYSIGKEQFEEIWHRSLLIWGVFVIGAMIIQFVTISRFHKGDTYPTPFILGVTAMATAVSGLMVRFRPLIIGGLVFLVAAIVSIYLRGTEQLLVLAIAMVFGYLIPGYILRSSKNGDDV